MTVVALYIKRLHRGEALHKVVYFLVILCNLLPEISANIATSLQAWMGQVFAYIYQFQMSKYIVNQSSAHEPAFFCNLAQCVTTILSNPAYMEVKS